MVERRLRPIAPVEHTNEREHRRLLADRANAGVPKDGSEGMTGPLPLMSFTAAELTGDFAASLWPGAVVYISDENAFALSNGTTWVRGITSAAALGDPNADRIVFFDDSAGTITYLTVGTGLAISGTNLNITTVPVANGGTGQTTEAEALGEMTQALTEDTTPDRANDFVSVYDASGDTGKKVSLQNVAGGWVQLETGSVTAGSSTKDFVLTAYTAYKAIRLSMIGIDPSADCNLFLRTSSDGGSSYDAGASDYEWGYIGLGSGGSAHTGDAADSEIEINVMGGASANEIAHFELTIWNQTAAQSTLVTYLAVALDTAGILTHTRGAGRRVAAADVDAFRILPSTGTFAVASYSLQGLVG